MTDTVDGLIRVSRVGDRKGDSFISPEVQRRQIANYCATFGLTIGEWLEELDVSGGTTNRHLLNRALQRIECGQSSGLIVSKLDRFARNTGEGLGAIKRITDAGGRFICVEQNFDTSTPQGWFFMTVLLAFAELERENRRLEWAVSVKEAIDRGLYVAKAPLGYLKCNTKTLVPDEAVAPFIRDVYLLRAQGAGWQSATGTFSHGIRISRQGVKKLVANTAYKGWARSGVAINEHAHEPLVTEAEWQLAQQTRTTGHLPSPEAKSANCLLLGLAWCGSCGYALHVHGKKGGSLSYQCRKLHGRLTCPRPTSIRVGLTDDHVERGILNAFNPGGYLAEAVEDIEAVTEAAKRVEEAQRELDAYLSNTKLTSVVSADAFARGAEERQATLDLARSSLTGATSRSGATATLPNGNLIEAWPSLPTLAKRKILRAFIGRVVIAPAEKRGQRSGHERRIQIILTGDVVLAASDEARRR